MRGMISLSLVFLFALAFSHMIGCVDESDDDDDESNDSVDDDADDAADDDTDDDADDDTDDDAEQPYHSWMRPCDVDGEPGPEFIVVEYAPSGVTSSYRLHLRGLDGADVAFYDVPSAGASTYVSISLSLVNLDDDPQCEIVLAQSFQRYSEGTYDSRVQVFKGSGFDIVFDTGLIEERLNYVDTTVDVNGGGPELILYGVATWTGTSRIEVYDGHDDFRELWRQTGAWDGGLLLLGRRHATGASFEPCASTAGPAFALVRYPMYQGESGQWRAQWIDPDGHILSTVGPYDLDAAENADADLMPLAGTDECALVLASIDAGETQSRFRVFDTDGVITHEGSLDAGSYWRVRANADADGDGAADVLLWTNYVADTKGVWVALSSENFALRPIVTADQREPILPTFWRTSPWMQSGVDVGSGAPNFYVGPFGDSNLSGAQVTWRSVGPDLSLTGRDLSVDMNPALDLGGDALAYWIDSDRPAVALNAWSIYYIAGKGPTPIEHGRWSQFHAGEIDAWWTSVEADGAFEIGPIWDFNSDGVADILQSDGAQPLTLRSSDDMAILWDGAPGDLAIVGEWF